MQWMSYINSRFGEIKNISTENAESLDSMFSGCNKLKEITFESEDAEPSLKEYNYQKILTFFYL